MDAAAVPRDLAISERSIWNFSSNTASILSSSACASRRFVRLIAGIDTLESDELCALCMVGNDERRLMAGVKMSSESMLSRLRPGSVTKRDRDLFADMEMAGTAKSSREGRCEWSKISREPSRERTVRRVFSSPTRALNTPAGTVLVEGGFLKSRGMGARFSFVTATVGMYGSLFSFSSESLSGESSFSSSISAGSSRRRIESLGKPEKVRGCNGPPLACKS